MSKLELVAPRAPHRGFEGSDAELVAAFRRGEPAAQRAFHSRYASHTFRVLVRVLGTDQELDDLHHEVYVRALRSLPRLRKPEAFKAWLTAITVHVARTAIAQRQRRRWLRFGAPDELPDPPAVVATEEASEALRATYRILDELPADERVALALRYIDGMELKEVASACRVSLSTAKRRLARAERRFVAKARRSPALHPWIEEGTRWNLS